MPAWMCLRVCACVFVFMLVCMYCMYTCLNVIVCLFARVNVCVCMYALHAWLFVCNCVFVCSRVCVFVFVLWLCVYIVCMFVCMWLCVCLCVWLCLRVCVCVYSLCVFVCVSSPITVWPVRTAPDNHNVLLQTYYLFWVNYRSQYLSISTAHIVPILTHQTAS